MRASGGGFTGNGCVGEYHSPGTSPAVTLRSSTPNTGLPVSRFRMNIQPVLPISAIAGIFLPFTVMSSSTARRRIIVIPQIVMDGLEIPLELSGLRIHGHQAVAEKIRARPVAAVVVGSRPIDSHIKDAALRVGSHGPSPDIGSGTVLPAVVQPGLMTHFARPRHGVKIP